jgi:hypothetical protein
MSPQIVDCQILDPNLVVTLSSGRILSVSLLFFPHLAQAPTQQRNSWFIIEGGIGVHWPLINQDVSLRHLLDLAPQ